MDILAGILLAAGLFFLAISCLGLIRLPDFYTRNHAAGKSGTLAAMLILLGLAIYHRFDITILRLLIIFLFFAVTGPTATHVVARAAFRMGLEPWTLKNRNPQFASDDACCDVQTEDGEEGAGQC
jgi:multicomponent Na+:H+ antiporter subunit G